MASHIAKPILRARLSSRPANGAATFIPQVRKVVFEFCPHWPSSHNLRTYLHNHLEDVARRHPHVEFVVKERKNKQPIARGFYLNDNEKVVPLNGFETNGVANKVQLLLDSSGARIVPLKRRTVVSTTESARGIWSGLHDQPYQI
ncbi:unnamed protein product [Peniophora sp. CBMAI 1063]|nr:unnamed protein product [Peniophora sp. CBMAI 1063]